MKIRWAGHAQFVINTAGKTIVTDPAALSYGYPQIPETPDIVTVSHGHGDHSATDALKGSFQVIKTEGIHQLDGVNITGYPSFHDPEQGQLRGANILFKFESEGLTVVHLGDLGETLSDEAVKALGKVDVLMIPIGSVYTIDADGAYALVNRIQPKIVLPMHYMTPQLSFTLDPAEKFTGKFDEVLYRPSIEVAPENLPQTTQVVMLTL